MSKMIPVCTLLSLSLAFGLLFRAVAAIYPDVSQVWTFRVTGMMSLSLICAALRWWLSLRRLKGMLGRASEIYTRSGKLFRSWFTLNNLEWVAGASVLGSAILLALGFSRLSLAVIAGLAAITTAGVLLTVLGSMYARSGNKPAFLSMCWSPQVLGGTLRPWPRLRKVLFLSARCEEAARVCPDDLLRIHISLQEGRMRDLESYDATRIGEMRYGWLAGQEMVNRAAIYGILFLLTFTLALLAPLPTRAPSRPPSLARFLTGTSEQIQHPGNPQTIQDREQADGAGGKASASTEGSSEESGAGEDSAESADGSGDSAEGSDTGEERTESADGTGDSSEGSDTGEDSTGSADGSGDSAEGADTGEDSPESASGSGDSAQGADTGEDSTGSADGSGDSSEGSDTGEDSSESADGTGDSSEGSGTGEDRAESADGRGAQVVNSTDQETESPGDRQSLQDELVPPPDRPIPPGDPAQITLLDIPPAGPGYGVSGQTAWSTPQPGITPAPYQGPRRHPDTDQSSANLHRRFLQWVPNWIKGLLAP